MKISTILLLIIVLINCDDDYCNLCNNHIACNNTGEIADECYNKSMVIDLDTETEIKDIFINLHNKHRNDIANGIYSDYEPAEKMPTLEWDDELAQLANFNVNTCSFETDKCRLTSNNTEFGQNIGYWAGYPIIDPKYIIYRTVNKWFYTHKYCNMSVIDNFKNETKCETFTVMVNDKNTRFGCAILQQFDIPFDSYTITCNYGIDNMINMTIYTSGITASECLTGINYDYPSLCSKREIIKKPSVKDVSGDN